MTQNSNSKRSIIDKKAVMISGGSVLLKQHRDSKLRKLKTQKRNPANFDYLNQIEQEKNRVNQEVRDRNSKLMHLIKTKNALISTKSDL